MESAILGIDTSCYTTSVAVVSGQRQLICEERMLIPVPKESCGIAQNQALFHHIKQVPQCLEKLFSRIDKQKITGICASARPRPADGSYMPVFVFSESLGRSLAAAAQIPFFVSTHQEGHLTAALWSQNLDWDDFLAVHLSGGTTELLLAAKEKDGFSVEVLGGCDLAAGQMVDRVGVALGLSFPAGPQLELLAKTAVKPNFKLPVAAKGLQISFSGPESAAQRLIKKGIDHGALAVALFENIASTLSQVIATAAERTGLNRVLIAGGVAANSLVKNELAIRLPSLEVRFAEPDFAGDNAVGVALLGLQKYLGEKG